MIRWFATRRELARLAKDAQFWRERALALEDKLESERKYNDEHRLALIDRCLTGVVKVPAVRDEVKQSVTDPQAERNLAAQAKRDFLDDKLSQLKEWAREDGKTDADAQNVYDQNLTAYELEFESQYY